MIKVHNDIIPFKGYKALTAWPFLFIRNDLWRWTDEDERHENIHGEQQKELLPIGIAIALGMLLTGSGWWCLLALPLPLYLYGIFYLIRLLRHNDHSMAYHNNPFEQEAYTYEKDVYYLSRRKHFSWLRFIGKTTINK